MTTLNFNVKVKAGKRTPAEVECYYTAVNDKTLTLVNGKEIKGSQIADWIATELHKALEKTEKQS